jgi:RNA polymerase sigma-70 factor, ECF subfamily
MEETDWLGERFAAERSRLVALAARMLGSRDDAEDAVQESWMRLTQADHSAVENLSGWLTTVVSRVCLDQLRSRRTRDHQLLEAEHLDQRDEASPQADAEQEVLLAESVGLAMLVVLDILEPAERVAFVLHDMFAVPFEEIGTILERSPAAARQLASRARRRVRGQEVGHHCDRVRQASLVEAFLAASRAGDFDALLAVLHPDVVLRADDTAAGMGVARELRGRADVATFSRRAGGAVAALVDGLPGAVWMPGGRPRVVFLFTITDSQIIEIKLVADADSMSEISLVVPEPPASKGSTN